MSYKNILIITDNSVQYKRFKEIVERKNLNKDHRFEYRHSKDYTEIHELPEFKDGLSIIDVNEQIDEILSTYDLVISIHCYQFFPKKLVNTIKCINIHPGYNPINRGWYPQVFAIINKLELGATIHEMDEKLDHGAIIAQKKVDINAWDTSITLYDRVLIAEQELIEDNIEQILSNSYTTQTPNSKGNFYTKNNFTELCELPMSQNATYSDVIDRLRALSHGKYKNAWFIDEKTGKKIYVSISLTAERDE